MENLQYELNDFCQRYQLNINLPKKNFKQSKHQVQKLVISEELLTGIQELFADDFENLNYCKLDLPETLAVK